MIARELIPKLQTALTTGNSVVNVVLRMVKVSNPAAIVEACLEPMYGASGSYAVIQYGDSDPLGNILKSHEVAVRATFDLQSAITHLLTVVDGGHNIIIEGIIYPTATPYVDSVSYPDSETAYNASSAMFGKKLDPNMKIKT